MSSAELPEPPHGRLELLRELVAELRPQVLTTHSEHGLQGVSGLVGQYMRALEQIEALEKALPAAEGTVLDELAKRRSGKPTTSRPVRAEKRQQRR